MQTLVRVFLWAGLILGAFLIIALARHQPSAAAATSAARPAAVLHEQPSSFGPGWCDNSCLSLTEWDGLVQDGRLKAALIIAYQYVPEFRSLAQAATLRGTR